MAVENLAGRVGKVAGVCEQKGEEGEEVVRVCSELMWGSKKGKCCFKKRVCVEASEERRAGGWM